MSTIRERFSAAADFFAEQRAVVLTSFNVGIEFLQDRALPVLLGAGGGTREAVRQDLHERLAATAVTVYYDPTAGAVPSGELAYVARPVPLRGRLFHPKLTIVAGIGHDERHWVYMAVASANLSMSGWARNAECVGETWICTPKQQSWSALTQFLDWLQTHAALEDEPDQQEATNQVRRTLAAMPDRRRPADEKGQPWAGTLDHKLYSSVVNTEGFPTFLREDRARRPTRLWAYSPYWADVERGIDAFDARETRLFPALTHRADRLSLGRSQVPKSAIVAHNPEDIGDRFWHMKSYWIEFGQRSLTAVGSCNFTGPGLAGGHGNVEAMLVVEGDDGWLPDGDEVDPDDPRFPDDPPDDDAPTPAPVAVVVAWDWRDNCWRWWLSPGPSQTDFTLTAPGLLPRSIDGGTGRGDGQAPPVGSNFELRYTDAAGPQVWVRPVVEINLSRSTRIYGRPLTVEEIIASWNGRRPSRTLDDDGDLQIAERTEGAPGPEEIPISFGTVNLFDFYRSMRQLRRSLNEAAANDSARRAALLGRPDSVMTMVRLTTADAGVPAVRFLVLHELISLLEEHAELVGPGLIDDARAIHSGVTEELREALATAPDSADLDVVTLVEWVKAELQRAEVVVR